MQTIFKVLKAIDMQNNRLQYLLFSLFLINIISVGHAEKSAKMPVTAVSTRPANFADIIQPLLPSVVNISAIIKNKIGSNSQSKQQILLNELLNQFLHGLRPKQKKELYAGSGFIIKQVKGYGYVVTAHHVIKNADSVKITLNNDKEYDATVVGFDKRTDIALLKFKTSDKLTTVAWGNSSKLRVGEWTIVVGNPFGLSSTVTVGVVSTIARNIDKTKLRGDADYVRGYIQTDAPINIGNSGGPMFDIYGNVQAVITSIISPTGGSVGIGFGVPANLAGKVIEQILKYGHTRRGWIGVSIQNINKGMTESLGLKKTQGALVAQIISNGPADKAGIKSRDVITHFNGQEIEKSDEVPYLVGNTTIGSKVPVKIWRDGKAITANIVVGEFEKAEAEGLIGNNDNKVASNIKDELAAMIGFSVLPINNILRSKYDISNNVNGVVITNINTESKAYDKMLRIGDVIEQVSYENKSIIPTTSRDIINFIANAKKQKRQKILVLINRKGSPYYVALSFDKNDK